MIARVFPRRTNATPVDDYAFVGPPPFREYLPDDITAIHISVVFTWDLPEAWRLADAWESLRIAPVKVGGPATGMRGEYFMPGEYLKPGYVITSRGCPNRHCWFCSVPKREGNVRQLPVTFGNNVLDDNLLACSEKHFMSVFNMLSVEKKLKQRIYFTGGLEAKRLKAWHVELLKTLRPKEMFFAYDTPDDLPPLEEAMRLFREAEYGTRSNLRCYVLIGYAGDTFEQAEHRLRTVLRLGMCPMAMLYQDQRGEIRQDREWKKFQRLWARPALIYVREKAVMAV